MKKNPEDLHNRRFSKEFIYFPFQRRVLQTTEMNGCGDKVCPCVRYIGKKNLYRKVINEFGTRFGEYFIKFWFRFLDDCFVPWTRSITELHHLHYILNTLHPDIKFTI